MNHTTLVSTELLKQHLNDSKWIMIDCCFSLTDSEGGAKTYRMGHIPNAHYAHLDKDLSSAKKTYTGRHPLPDLNLLAKKPGQWDVTNNSQVIVYDNASGAFAGRLWWLLRYMGHDSVAVLDGGINHWKKLGMPLTTTLPPKKINIFRPYTNHSALLSANKISNALAAKKITLIDARASERFLGEHEPIDPVSGHIPQTINGAFQLNLDDNGHFLPKTKLRQQFMAILETTKPEQTVYMRGSGVTACHNLLAMEHAGLSGSKLYPGSWSEWITNTNRSIQLK